MAGRGELRPFGRRAAPLLLGAALGLCGLAAVPGPAAAQEVAPFQAPFLTLDEERLFTQSLWGKRAEADLSAAATQLASENRQLEAQLEAEEKDLTERRGKTPPAAFRSLADEFDKKVVAIRAAQDAKGRALSRRREVERRAFFAAALPVLSEVLQRHGAVAVLDERAILLSDRQINVTEELLALVDARIGAGQPPPEDPAASAAPEGGQGAGSGGEGPGSEGPGEVLLPDPPGAPDAPETRGAAGGSN